MISFSSDQRILVTGASSGIGAAIALQCNALGATVIANGRSCEKLKAVKLKSAHPEAFHLESLDLLENIKFLEQWVAGIRERYGALNGMAYAAGRTMTAPFMLYDLDQAHELFDILCHAPLALARAILNRKNCLPGCSLVFIAAASAIVPNKGLSVYSAAKAALVCAARGMSKELAPRGIRVNCISPGLVRTPMLDETVALLGEDFLQEEGALYPLGLGLPEDVSNLTAFLLSSAGRWITGQNCLIDGGRLA